MCHYDEFEMTLSKALEIMAKRKLIIPLDKPTEGKTIGGRLNQWCNYHQTYGHHTDFCRNLRDKLQDLIDEGKIPKPNVATNPLPKHEG